MIHLKHPTAPAWVEAVLDDFDAFLLDHAACERKASATAMSFVAHYPDRPELVDGMITLAREELEHFHEVYRRIAARGLVLPPDTRDPYIRALLALVRRDSEVYLLDRLLVFGLVEARGCERFALLAEALEPGELQTFYADLSRSEARHRALFLRLARCYYDEEVVGTRAEALSEAEAHIVAELPLRPAVH
ncbi:MAG: tRNA-(ms[2]io[6]A)-hydroxylase [Deltaproteobacteria bacterium]|nr:MAG: tRNA-(ms[2]io[6]A)-hydroxylase [Deltaproteobacteria bacterium]